MLVVTRDAILLGLPRHGPSTVMQGLVKIRVVGILMADKSFGDRVSKRLMPPEQII